jgi:hypothetical protein
LKAVLDFDHLFAIERRSGNLPIWRNPCLSRRRPRLHPDGSQDFIEESPKVSIHTLSVPLGT